MPLSYAEQFTVDTLENGLSLITIGGEDRYLVVPEGQQAPQTDADITVLQQPIDSIYLGRDERDGLLYLAWRAGHHLALRHQGGRLVSRRGAAGP